MTRDAAPVSASLDGPGGIDLDTVSIAQLRQGLASGSFTAAELLQCYLDRITRLNPSLRAVIAVHPDAMAAAHASDSGRRQGRTQGALAGVPILVKDNVAVAGLPTTAGSLALGGSAPPDAFCVARLREAGAVILGKANLSEWANFRSEHSTSGWSSVGGQACNPHVLDRSPSGSSSGSAAAVAAHLAAVAVGTETDGSIVSPASACGIAGVKPTLGLVSRSGIVPISHLQDTAGPLTRSIADAAILLGVLAGADETDPQTRSIPSTLDVSGLHKGALRGSRLGVWRSASSSAGSATQAVLDEAVAALRDGGAQVIDPIELPDADQITEPEFESLCHEFKHDLNMYLATLAPGHPRTLAEVIEYNARNAERVMSFFGQDIFERAEATSGDLTAEDYLAARSRAVRLARRALETPLAVHTLDAIVALTAEVAWPIDRARGDPEMFETSGPAAVTGWPAVSVPAGMVLGLPVGITFTGAAWSDARLLGFAYAFEQATRARRPPAYLATVGPPPV